MSNIAPPTMPEPDDNNNAVLGAASDVLESATANALIEMQMNKAVRVGTMLRLWRELMLDEGDTAVGFSFPVDWVDHASMDIFHSFFPPLDLPDQEMIHGYEEPDDDDD